MRSAQPDPPFSPRVLLADDPVFLEHVAPPGHPERSERLLAVKKGLGLAGAAHGGGDGSACFERLSFEDASDDQLALVHSAEHIASLGHLAGRSGYLDSDTFVSPHSVAAARRAAGGTIELSEALLAGRARFGIATPRPPGHHALADRAMGFCLLNNVALAAAYARARGSERVLVVDWDVHHGNGTQDIFYADPAVLFISLHQFPCYPGTGDATELGAGEGRGATVNVPLPQAATDAVYAAAFERIVLPIIEQFAPTLALVSSGFDAHARDPLAEMQLSSDCFGALTRALVARLDPGCPLGIVLEGGYDLEALTASSQAVAAALLEAQRPGAPSLRAAANLPLEHEAALGRAAAAQSPHWKFS